MANRVGIEEACRVEHQKDELLVKKDLMDLRWFQKRSEFREIDLQGSCERTFVSEAKNLHPRGA